MTYAAVFFTWLQRSEACHAIIASMMLTQLPTATTAHQDPDRFGHDASTFYKHIDVMPVEPASYVTVYSAGPLEQLIHKLTVASLVRCSDTIFSCVSVKQEDNKFNRGEQALWPVAPFEELSKQVKADWEKLFVTILQLGEDDEALAQEVACVSQRHDYRQVH